MGGTHKTITKQTKKREDGGSGRTPRGLPAASLGERTGWEINGKADNGVG